MTSHGYKQNEISQQLGMRTKIFKTSYYTALRQWLINTHLTGGVQISLGGGGAAMVRYQRGISP